MNETGMPTHQKVLVGWHGLVLLVLVLMFLAPKEGGRFHWIWIPVVLTPILVLAATYAPIRFNTRAVAYWVIAGITIPTAAAGLTSIIGWLFIVSIIMLIWAARRENPAEEIVQY